MKYNLDDKPPLGATLLYGLQWWIVSLPCIIIMGTVIGQIHYPSDIAAQTFYMQKLFAVAGITTIIQVLWGHRLPLIIGPASVLLIGITASSPVSISTVYTSIIIGGIFVALLAYTGVLAKIRCIFTTRVVTVILILIPFTLMPVIINLVLANENHILFNLAYAFILVLILLLCNKWLPGVWKSTTVVWGIVIGTVLYYSIFKNIVNIDTLTNDKSNVTTSLFLSNLDFDAGTILAFLFCYFALIVNELGSIEAVGQMLGSNEIRKRIKFGVGMAGISNMVSGSMGVIGSVDYSMSTGVISATGCASRYTLIPTGIGLLICAFLPQAIISLHVIPSIVMGALLIYLMAGQLSSAFVMLTSEKATFNFNDGIVMGLPVMVAVLISFIPQQATSQIPALIRPIIGNGFVMGVIVVLLLEHIVFRKK